MKTDTETKNLKLNRQNSRTTLDSAGPPLSPRPSPLSLHRVACRAEASVRRRGPRLDRRTTWERLSQIDDMIASATYPSRRMMALKLGVAQRTITRDLHFMITKRKLPIAYDERRYGYYYSTPV